MLSDSGVAFVVELSSLICVCVCKSPICKFGLDSMSTVCLAGGVYQ